MNRLAAVSQLGSAIERKCTAVVFELSIHVDVLIDLHLYGEERRRCEVRTYVWHMLFPGSQPWLSAPDLKPAKKGAPADERDVTRDEDRECEGRKTRRSIPMPGSRPQAQMCQSTEPESASPTTSPFELAAAARSIEVSPATAGDFTGARGQSGADLVTVIEADVIPRLLMMHRVGREADGAAKHVHPPFKRARAKHSIPAPDRFSAKEVADLLDLVRHDTLEASLRYVQAQQDRGHPVERIFASLLAPVARQLGEMWTADEVSFLEVSLAVARIQRILFEYCQRTDAPPGSSGTVLLTTTPGEQHTLGMHMAAEDFKRAGVQVVSLVPSTVKEIEDALRSERFDLVGFSLGSESLIEKLAETIEATRVAARQARVTIVVGGPAAALVRARESQLGADHIVHEVAEAIAILLQGTLQDSVC